MCKSSWLLKNLIWVLNQCLPSPNHPAGNSFPKQPCWPRKSVRHSSRVWAGPAVLPCPQEVLTSHTGSASHRWLGVCYKNGSPGQSWSPQWGHLSRSGHGRRSGWRAESPLGMWPGSQMTCGPSRGIRNLQHLATWGTSPRSASS